MGGGIAVVAAGIDHRIERVAAVVATPDWLRPGLHDAFNPERVSKHGERDVCAQYSYDLPNPLTHLDAYARGPAIHFVCGEHDTHVPSDGALRFLSAWREAHRGAADRGQVTMIPGLRHNGRPERWSVVALLSDVAHSPLSLRELRRYGTSIRSMRETMARTIASPVSSASSL
jgi:hypothetical protein